MTGINTYNFTDAETGKSIDASYVTDGTAKAWIDNDMSATVNDSLNVSSCTDIGTALFSPQYTSSFGTSSYSITGCVDTGASSTAARLLMVYDKTASDVSYHIEDDASAATESSVNAGFIQAMGDLA